MAAVARLALLIMAVAAVAHASDPVTPELPTPRHAGAWTSPGSGRGLSGSHGGVRKMLQSNVPSPNDIRQLYEVSLMMLSDAVAANVTQPGQLQQQLLAQVAAGIQAAFSRGSSGVNPGIEFSKPSLPSPTKEPRRVSLNVALYVTCRDVNDRVAARSEPGDQRGYNWVETVMLGSASDVIQNFTRAPPLAVVYTSIMGFSSNADGRSNCQWLGALGVSSTTSNTGKILQYAVAIPVCILALAFIIWKLKGRVCCSPRQGPQAYSSNLPVTQGGPVVPPQANLQMAPMSNLVVGTPLYIADGLGGPQGKAAAGCTMAAQPPSVAYAPAPGPAYAQQSPAEGSDPYTAAAAALRAEAAAAGYTIPAASATQAAANDSRPVSCGAVTYYE